jgi:hypothetical protein
MRIILSVPGPSLHPGLLRAVSLATDSQHEISVLPQGSCAWDGFNGPWVEALNLQERGEADLFAMVHSDIVPEEPRFLDSLVRERERCGVDLISAAIPLKDGRGLMSCGVGRPDTSWTPLRRLSVREVCNLPETFTAADLGYPGHPLLHNNGLWLADLRREVFHRCDPDGCLSAYFDFPRRIPRGPDGRWTVQGESEDWFFSRKLFELGATTAVTRLVKLRHCGEYGYPNFVPWGSHATDTEAGFEKPVA